MHDDAEPLLPLDKAEREQVAFRSIYDPAACHSVVHQDRPDFVVRLHPDQQPFGVEVTELHRTEADARLIHHPAYFTELLAGTRRMHADDPETLGVTTVTVSDKEGNVKYESLRVLVRKEPSQSEHSDALGELVRGKDAKAAHYESNLSHVNLIVLDTFAAGPQPQAQYCTRDLLGSSLRSAVTASRFDEILVATPDSDGRFWHRPLRLLLLFESFYLFLRAIDSYEGDVPALTPQDAAGWFAALTDLPDVRLGTDPANGAKRAYWSRYGVCCGDSIEILDNHDFGRSTPVAENALPEIPDQMRDSLVAHLKEFSRTQAFHCEMWLPEPHGSAT